MLIETLPRVLALTGAMLLSLGPVADEPAVKAPASPAAAAAPVPTLTAPTMAADRLDVSEELAAIIKKHNVPALTIMALQDGQIVATGVAGKRKREGEKLATMDDRWHLGSCTKSMTATLCAVLVERGTLRWEQTLAESFPDFADKMHPEYRKVMLRQLLTNRGGVPEGLNEGGLWGKLWNYKGTTTAARRLMLEAVTTREPKPAPGTFTYSNGGFALAGLIVEEATGKAWEELMREHVFGPLGITTAGFGAPGTAGKEEEDQPWGHMAAGVPMIPGPSADNPPAIGPAGTVHMSIGDWAKYVQAHLDGEKLIAEQGWKRPGGEASPSRPASLLKAESWKTLHTAAPKIAEKDTAYAMGWAVTERPWAVPGPGKPGRVIVHSGSNTMWFCVVWAAPDRNFAVLVCCNQGGPGGAATDDAASMVIGKLGERKK